MNRNHSIKQKQIKRKESNEIEIKFDRTKYMRTIISLDDDNKKFNKLADTTYFTKGSRRSYQKPRDIINL